MTPNSPDQSADLFLSFDEETGFYRRHVFQYEMNRWVDEASQNQRSFLVFDLGFEEEGAVIEQGDLLLRDVVIVALSNSLSILSAQGWMLCRFAQHRLVLCSPSFDHPANGEMYAEQVLSAIGRTEVSGRSDLPIPVRVGQAQYPNDTVNPADLVEYAHLAMLFAVNSSYDRGLSVVRSRFLPAMGQQALRQQALMDGLEQAIEHAALSIRIQPELQIQSRQLETLVVFPVWEHEQWGQVEAVELYRIARLSCLSIRLVQWVLENALTQIQHLISTYRLKCSVSVSLPEDFLHLLPAQEFLLETVQKHDLANSQIELGFQERTLQTSNGLVCRSLQALAKKGFRLSLEGFGLGAASLNTLRRLPFDKVVIAQSVIEKVVTQIDDFYLASAIVSMAQSLKIRVVAQGVATPSQSAILMRMNCPTARGDFFGPAVLAADFGAWWQQDQEELGQRGKNGTEPKKPGLLLVDDESNILAALRRLLRVDGYTIFCAHSAQEAFGILAVEPIDVILSDQRMPEMSGTEFLSKVKERYPHTVRLVLSGYTDIHSVTEAINEGAIYKFLTKPWDDEQLRANLREAFVRHNIEMQNFRLKQEVEQINEELMQLNHMLELKVNERNERIERSNEFRRVMQEMFNLLPLGVIGLDRAGDIIALNSAATRLLKVFAGDLMSADFSALPEPVSDVLRGVFFESMGGECRQRIQLHGRELELSIREMGTYSKSSGYLLILQEYQSEVVI